MLGAVGFAELKPILDEIATTNIAEHVYLVLLRLHRLNLHEATQQAALSSLGFVWRAHPRLLQRAASFDILDAALAPASRPPDQLHVLRIIQDFLASQEGREQEENRKPIAAKKGAAGKKKGVRIDDLVGNTDGFADGSVAGIVSQRFLEPILRLAVSPVGPLQRVAVEILVTVSRSGFTHPFRVWPTLIAVTASPDSSLVEKAYASAAVLHTKHSSLLASKYLDPARTMHAYLRSLNPSEPVQGHSIEPGGVPASRFARWYSLVQKDKRTVGLDFLRALARVFEVEAGEACGEEDLSLARFVAEGLSALEFRKAEEVMVVVAGLVRGLAVGGLQVVHLLEGERHGLLREEGVGTGSPRNGGRDGEDEHDDRSDTMARKSPVEVGLSLHTHA